MGSKKHNEQKIILPEKIKIIKTKTKSNFWGVFSGMLMAFIFIFGMGLVICMALMHAITSHFLTNALQLNQIIEYSLIICLICSNIILLILLSKYFSEEKEIEKEEIVKIKEVKE